MWIYELISFSLICRHSQASLLPGNDLSDGFDFNMILIDLAASVFCPMCCPGGLENWSLNVPIFPTLTVKHDIKSNWIIILCDEIQLKFHKAVILIYWSNKFHLKVFKVSDGQVHLTCHKVFFIRHIFGLETTNQVWWNKGGKNKGKVTVVHRFELSLCYLLNRLL